MYHRLITKKEIKYSERGKKILRRNKSLTYNTGRQHWAMVSSGPPPERNTRGEKKKKEGTQTDKIILRPQIRHLKNLILHSTMSL